MNRRLPWILMAILLAFVLAGACNKARSDEVSEEAKVLALKLGYALNGDSMVRWGSIDLTDPNVVASGPIPRFVPIERVKPTAPKKEKRK